MVRSTFPCTNYSWISIIKDIYQLFSQTFLPFTHVLRTLPWRSRTTRSASAPGLREPFLFSIPRHLETAGEVHTVHRCPKNAHLAGFKVAHLIASASEHPVNCTKLRTHLSRVTTLKMDIDEQRKSDEARGASIETTHKDCLTFRRVSWYLLDRACRLP